MTRLLQIGHLLLLLAGIAFLVILGWRAWRVSDELDAVLKPLPAMEQKVNLELDEAHRLTLEAGLTAMEARKASAEERASLAKWNRAITATLLNANRTIAAVGESASAVTETAHSATEDMKTLNTSIAAAQPLIEDSDGVVKQFSLAVVDTAKNLQSMTADGKRITKDAADEADKLAHPNKKKLTFWGGVWIGLTYAHKLMPPIF